MIRQQQAGRRLSAPAGSGKTFSLRSWIGASGLAGRAASVPVQDEERDPQRFWITVADALAAPLPVRELVRPLTAAPDLDGWEIVERLLKDLARLDKPVWLVVDDVYELASAKLLAHLELFADARAGPEQRRRGAGGSAPASQVIAESPVRVRPVHPARHEAGHIGAGSADRHRQSRVGTHTAV